MQLTSLDYTTWFQLPHVSPQDLEVIETIQGRLMGDPAYEHTVARINEQDPEVNLVN